MDNLMAGYRSRLLKLSTTNVSDALDTLSLKGATYGINAVWDGAPKIVGRAVTFRMIAAGLTAPKVHAAIEAIDAAKEGDIIVIDSGGRLDTNAWGGVVAAGAKMKGLSGVVVDGAVRDVDDYIELQFPVYARGKVVTTARGRTIIDGTNIMIQFGGVQVRPGDVVFADINGVVIIPQERIDDVVNSAEALFDREQQMVKDILSGMSMGEADRKYSYEQMLKKKG
jgi:4-hydroxy-4-methyl-2-oxoglutarate aldolase